MVRIIKFLLAGTCALFMLHAGTFPPVPPEAWLLKASDTSGTGAVILEKSLTLGLFTIDTRIRIRITSEAGKSAAEFATFSKDCYDIEGRTLYPDGKVTPFTKKDLQTKTVAKLGSTEIERTVLIPPGLNSDCIVDIHWVESKKFLEGARRFGAMETRDLSDRFPVRWGMVEVPTTFPWAWSLLHGRAGKVEKAAQRSPVKITFQDIPPIEELPYTVAAARNPTRLLLWPTQEILHPGVEKGPDGYWNEVGRLILKPWMVDNVERGRAYRALSEELRKDAPTSPQQFGAELARRLDLAVQNVSYLTYEEYAKRNKKDAEREIESGDLNASAQRRWTNGMGMTHLFFEVLKDAKIYPLVALVANRDHQIFNPKLLTWTQFHDVLIGIEEAGKGTMWFDPSLRHGTPGMIDDHYQGTTAISFDSLTWKGTVFTVPVQEARFNQQQSVYALELGEDEDLFTVNSRFVGLPEWSERRRFSHLEPKEQNRLLKERLEKHSRKLSITAAEVANATDPKNNLSWSAKGRIERDPGRRREVELFPVDWWPLWIPERMDPTRTELIVLPHALVHSANSSFVIPAGYQLGTVDPISRKNGFGEVSWALRRERVASGERCIVDLKVTVATCIAKASGYSDFKDFLGWVREACGRTLILERVR